VTTIVVLPGQVRKFNVCVQGQPGTQGSMDAIPYHKADGKLGVRVQHRKTTKRKLDNWRSDVKAAVERVLAIPGYEWPGPMEGPLQLVVTFTVPAVKQPRRVRWGSGLVEYVPWPFTRPDLDKYLRAVCDALTAAGVWLDDAQVVDARVTKVYPDTPITGAMATPGATIGVYQIATVRLPQDAVPQPPTPPTAGEPARPPAGALF